MHIDSSRIYEAGDGAALPIGLAKLTRLAFAGVDLGRIAGQLLGIFERDPSHAGALMDLSVIDQLNGNLDIGLTRQAMALRKQRVFHSTCCGVKPGLRMLAFVTAADIGANTPLEFLLEGSNIALTTVYVLPGRPLPTDLPDHDLAFVAVAASAQNRAVLSELDEMLAQWPVPIINLPSCLSVLARDELFSNLRSICGLKIPPVVRVRRDDLSAIAGAARLSQFLHRWGGPIVVKPSGSHAGNGLAKIDDEEGLSLYLTMHPEDCLISPFIDCQSGDGRFRKYRVLFVDQRPYAYHMAISDEWSTRYFEAGMELSAAKRSEEASFFADFDRDFCARHRAALTALVKRVGLAYFGIDCAETPSGDLVVFKADHTLLIHDMDPVDVFPYKPAQMRKIFDAFSAFLYKTAHADRSVRRRRGSGR